jgi:hypothetical protein
MAAKPKQNQKNQTKRGGPRPNSGRKRKPVTEIRSGLISQLAGTGEVPDELQNDAAGYAFRLFDRYMRDEAIGVTVRLDCAREVLNRVWGKPKQSVEVGGRVGGPMQLELLAPALLKVYGPGTPDGGA